jgi:hypothetical protein
MSADQVWIGGLGIIAVVLLGGVAWIMRWGYYKAMDGWGECNQSWHKYCSELNERYGARCIGLGRKVDELHRELSKAHIHYCNEIGELHEKINARDYVIGALKAQVRQKLYPEYERLTSENERLRTAPCGDEKLMSMAEWAALSAESRARINAYGQEHERLAAYANAGKVTEGDGEIPY